MGPGTSAARLAIDAAVPRPEPANLPPPTASDFKMDATASVPDPAKAAAPGTTANPPIRSLPKSSPHPPPRPNQPKHPRSKRPERNTEERHCGHDAGQRRQPPRRRACQGAREGCEQCARCRSAGRDKLREMLGGKSLRFFDRKAERTAVEKFYSTREYAPQWTEAGKLTDSAKASSRA